MELAQEVEGGFRGVQLLGEGVLNQTSHMGVDLIDAVLEGLELCLPLLLVCLTEYITWEGLQFLDLIFDGVDLLVDLLGTASNLFEIWTKNGKEFLNDGLGLAEVFKYLYHVDWSSEDFLLALEVPFLDCLLVLDVLPGVVVFLFPLLEHFDGLLDHFKGIFWSLHLEDLRDVDLSLYFVADFVGDTGQNLLELVLLSVDVSGDGPNQLEAGKERRECLIDKLQVTLLDVAELSV